MSNLAKVAACVALSMLTACRSAASGSGNFEDYADVNGDQAITEKVDSARIDNRAGVVHVIAEEREDIRIEARLKVRTGKKPDKLTTFADHVRVDTVDNELRISDAHIGTPDAENWQINLTVRVPAAMNVRANNEAGNVTVDGCKGDIRVDCSAGNVRVEAGAVGNLISKIGAGTLHVAVDELGGSTNLDIGAGNVDVTVAKPPRHELIAKCGTGDLHLDLPDASPGSYTITSNTGTIKIPGLPGLRVMRGPTSAAAEGRIGSGGARVELTCGVGNIRVD